MQAAFDANVLKQSATEIGKIKVAPRPGQFKSSTVRTLVRRPVHAEATSEDDWDHMAFQRTPQFSDYELAHITRNKKWSTK